MGRGDEARGTLKQLRKWEGVGIRETAMGLVFLCLLVYFIATTIRGAIISADERASLAREFQANPLFCTFVTVWALSLFVFLAAMFLPALKEREVFDSGWELWKASGAVFGVGCIVAWFWRSP